MMTAQAHAKCGFLISTYGIETWVASLVVRLLCADWDVGTGPLEKSNQPYSHVLGTRAGRVLLSETRALAEMETTTSQRTTAPRASARVGAPYSAWGLSQYKYLGREYDNRALNSVDLSLSLSHLSITHSFGIIIPVLSFTHSDHIMVQTSLLFALAAFTGLMEASPIRRSTSGKRGIAFPKAFNGQQGSQFTHAFAGQQSKISWMYDWEAVIDGEPINGLEYVPLLHSNQQWCTEGWTQNVANARAKYNVQSVLSFNEPDQVGYVIPSSPSYDSTSTNYLPVAEALLSPSTKPSPHTSNTCSPSPHKASPSVLPP
jgi:hypothetical protein